MIDRLPFQTFDTFGAASREMFEKKKAKYIHVQTRSLDFGYAAYGTPSSEDRKEGLLYLKIFADLMIKHGQHIEGLSFSYTKLGAKGAKQVVRIIENCPNLKVLELASCRLGSLHDWEKAEHKPCGFKLMMSAIAHHPSIQQIKDIDERNWFNPVEKMELLHFFNFGAR